MKLRTKITAIAALVILLAAAVGDSAIWMICRRVLLREAKQTALREITVLQTDLERLQTQGKARQLLRRKDKQLALKASRKLKEKGLRQRLVLKGAQKLLRRHLQKARHQKKKLPVKMQSSLLIQLQDIS